MGHRQVGFGVIRFGIERLLDGLGRLIEAVQVVEAHGAVKREVGIERIALTRPVELCQGFLVLPFPGLHHAQIVGDFAQRNHPFEGLEGALRGRKVAEKEFPRSGHEERLRVVVIRARNFGEPLAGRGVILPIEIKFPQRERRVMIRWVAPVGFREQRDAAVRVGRENPADVTLEGVQMQGRKAPPEILFPTGCKSRLVSGEHPPRELRRNVIEVGQFPLRLDRGVKLEGARVEQLGSSGKQVAAHAKAPHHGPVRAQNPSHLKLAGQGNRDAHRHAGLFRCLVPLVAAEYVAVPSGEPPGNQLRESFREPAKVRACALVVEGEHQDGAHALLGRSRNGHEQQDPSQLFRHVSSGHEAIIHSTVRTFGAYMNR